jgi:hypothetical protein
MAHQSPPALSNLNSDNGTAAPESVDVAEAVALMAGLGEAGDDEAEETASADGDEGDDAVAEGGGEGDDTADEAADEEAEASAEDGEAPEFWSAEDKAAWESVPAELRPVLKKYEQQRVEFVNEKAREAAAVRTQAAQDVERANAVIAQAAQWWQQTGPALQRAFASKWAQVDWKALAEKDPAEYARLDQERQKEQGLLADANRRQQEDTKIATERAAQALELVKQGENAKLAHKLPDYFGNPEKAQKTYSELGKFLFAKGIPADRIAQIHEAPIIEMALNAMRFEQAQKKASPVLRSSEGAVTSGAANTTAKLLGYQQRATPTRVAPGPARRTGNQASEAARQVGERFRKNGGNSIADAAELIRLNGL